MAGVEGRILASVNGSASSLTLLAGLLIALTPYPPMTQGKIERWHQTLKNCILLENYFYPATSKPKSRAGRRHFRPAAHSVQRKTHHKLLRGHSL